MPKKSSGARHNAQRQKVKAQKNFELVRDTSVEENELAETELEATALPALPAEPVTRSSKRSQTATTVAPAPAPVETLSEEHTTDTSSKSKASTRLAARRQSSLRRAPSLITPEHYAYVRKDLVTIAILATCLFAVIVFLYIFYGSVL